MNHLSLYPTLKYTKLKPAHPRALSALNLNSLHFKGETQSAQSLSMESESDEPSAHVNTTDLSELLLKLKGNDAQAWLTLQGMYIPLARGYAKSVSQFSKIPKSELAEAAEFGLLKGIGEMRKPSFDIWKTGVVDFLKIHIREAISEVLKTQRPDLSLDDNWGDSDGFFNPLEPVSKEQNPAETVSDSTLGASASREADAPLERFSPDDVYPALGVVEGWLLKTHPDLAADKGLSEAQLSKKMRLSEKNIHRLRLKVRAKARARIKHSRLKRKERQGIHQPYPHLKALDRLSIEKPLLIPVFGDSMGFFTPHQQKVIQLMGHFEMTPKQVAKTMGCSEEALSHLAIEIVKKMEDLLRQTLAPEKDVSFQEPITPLEELTKTLTLELKLSGLNAAHLLRLPFASRKLLQKAYLEKTPLDAEEALQMKAILEQLNTLTGQSPRQFRETLLNPLAPALPHLATLDSLAAQVVLGTIGQGQTVKEVARTLPKVTIAKAKEVLQDARVALRQALVKSKPASLLIETSPSELTPSRENQLLCESLLKEGLKGLTPDMLTRVITPYQHQVLVLRSQGKSYTDIATATGYGLSPIKAAVIQGIQALKKELKQVYFPPLMAEAGLAGFTDADQAALSPQVSRLFRQYFIEEQSLEKWAKNATAKQSGPTTAGTLGQALNTDVLSAIEELPAKQKEILLDFVSQDVSFSELARQRTIPLTSITSMVKAALVNIEKSLNPFALHHWLSDQLQDHVTSQDVLTHLSDPAQKLLRLLAKKELHLAATVIEMPNDMPIIEKLKQLDTKLDSAWQDLPPETQTLINTMAHGSYEINALQGACKKVGGTSDAKLIYRDKVSPAINIVFKKVGAAPLGTLLRLHGFDYILQSDVFETLPPKTKNILKYYLSQGRDLKPLALRIKGIALGEKDALHWLQQEVERGVGELTPYQQEIWQQFSENKFNAAEVARKIGKSQKAVAAALRLTLNKLEIAWQQDSVLMTLNRQGLVGLRTPEQLAIVGRPLQVILRDYFEKGYSLEPVLQHINTVKRIQNAEEQVIVLMKAIEKAIEGLSSDLQQSTLKAYASGEYTNYEAIAVAVGLKPQDKNRVGTTLDAALKNLRAVLENTPHVLLEY
jgi:DNA-directed RNA polymerase specialized sigma24 family protein